MDSFTLNLFLYFPENKLDYIPAVIELFFAIALCILVFRFIRRASIKQQEKALQLEQQILEKKEQQHPRP